MNTKKELIKKKVDFLFWALALGGLFLNLVGLVLIRIFLPPSDRVVILHYNSFLGIDAMSFNFRDEYFQLFLAPIGSLAIWLVNFLIALTFSKHSKDPEANFPEKKLVSYLLLSSGLVVQIELGIYLGALLVVNF